MAKFLLCLLIAVCWADEFPTFEAFVRSAGIAYPSAKEYAYRQSVYFDNLRRIRESRLQHSAATFAVNKFSDRTAAEFRSLLKYLPDNEEGKVSQLLNTDSATPLIVDWRAQGAVTPVPDMGDCGSIICGFGSASNVEGVNKIVNGKLVPLSAQEGMACAFESCGCYLRKTYEWYLNNTDGVIDTEQSWPFNETQCEIAVCDRKSRVAGAKFYELVQIPHSEEAMTAEVARGPVTVAVYCDQWQFYTGGVFTNCGNSQPDHVVTIVGYDDSAPTPYWILKNWWGVEWGAEGYMYLEKGSNQCNITYEPLTVSVHPNIH